MAVVGTAVGTTVGTTLLPACIGGRGKRAASTGKALTCTDRSILAIICFSAGIAQLVERNLAKVEVESSRLFSRSKFERGS